MPTRDIQSEAMDQNNQDNVPELTVNIEPTTVKKYTPQGPSNFIVLLKWVTTMIFASILLACLVVSKITIIGLAQSLNPGSKVTKENYQACFMCFAILLGPNVISIFRSVWNIIGRSDIPWPNFKTIIYVSMFKFLNGFNYLIRLICIS